MLLLLHEGGHAAIAWKQGLAVQRITVGLGPVLEHWQRGDTQVVLRAVPLAGMTTTGTGNTVATARRITEEPARSSRWATWVRELCTLMGGVLATLALAVGVGALVAFRERLTRTRWVWGRIVIADALVLTVFNFLPIPPLDGGRAVLGAVAALRGAPLNPSALFWVQVSGLALAVAPMTRWTRWTARIDRAALWWRAPSPTR